jgi:hypothetical protein
MITPQFTIRKYITKKQSSQNKVCPVAFVAESTFFLNIYIYLSEHQSLSNLILFYLILSDIKNKKMKKKMASIIEQIYLLYHTMT